MIRKISVTLSILLFVCWVTQVGNPMTVSIFQPDRAFAQSGFALEDFALYAQKNLRALLSHIVFRVIQ